MILLQAVGRAVSFTVDGMPNWRFVMAFVLELSSGMAILLTGPPAAPKAPRPAESLAKTD